MSRIARFEVSAVPVAVVRDDVLTLDPEETSGDCLILEIKKEEMIRLRAELDLALSTWDDVEDANCYSTFSIWGRPWPQGLDWKKPAPTFLSEEVVEEARIRQQREFDSMG